MMAGTALVPATASAQEIRFMCYSDGNECEVYDDVIDRFEEANPGVTVAVDVVPYQAILENLPVQLAAGEGPDLAKVTDLGGLNEYYLDLEPYVDAGYWEESFGGTLDWYRGGPDRQGIYGMHSQLTVTGAFVNATLFEQAGVDLPGEGATWEDWAEASRQVAEATGAPFPMAIDRSGHRVAGPAISYGAALFDENGDAILVDDGFTAFVQQFVDWHEDGTIARDVWAGQGGQTYQDAAQEFINGDLVFYYSGSWQVGRMDEQVGDFFDWQVVGSPCGPAGACSGMPGGAGIVGFAETDHPEEVAALIDFLAQEDVYGEVAARTRNIPAHLGVAASGVEFQDASDGAKAALNGFAGSLPDIHPAAFAYQGYAGNRAMFGITVERVSQAIVGELTVEEAMERAASDLAEAMAETN
ncbi:MAG: carbohydrate ABC transporter substrate-binding protein [Rhizobiales bacterium]|nr:carbohydrate ABC transporter substrate-binding protein [Hyphomicrobiales bacterium]MBO6699610.1 carbohydrate ABC transporter substrate-binding protein [Hyphomicrobiales bacterium]MBO6737148.1 carbohydrate ABC transporter substrate-binding protein [Hyphomicrobiales bacterium]MBO6911778.1 carbohydrate ABC transporter substrate-binding protein [Hyphomicrobiales bacterium]MBO6954715.1 carbohydrate ABC transporter substrate-binding protein [Hyphomicrobiales bacterium]